MTYWKIKCPKCGKVMTTVSDKYPKYHNQVICDCGHKFTSCYNIVEVIKGQNNNGTN